jgi:muramoyltetrapeptide carboxypeptidase
MINKQMFPTQISKIAVVAPGFSPVPTALAKFVQLCERQGVEVVLGKSLEEQSSSYLAASDQIRADDINIFFADETIDLIIAARGGYGCSRLLGLLDFELIKKSRAQLVGHSDLTSLQLAMYKNRCLNNINGLMAAVELVDAGLDSFSLDSLYKAICLESQKLPLKLLSGKREASSGPIFPMTLSILLSLLGTDYLPCFDGANILLEDVGEPLYKVDRMLQQLVHSRVFDNVSGVIFSDFGDVDVVDLAKGFGKAIGASVYSCEKFGHCLPRLSIPFGACSYISFDNNDLSLEICR